MTCILNSFEKKIHDEENMIRYIMSNKFGVETDNVAEIKQIIEKKKLSLAYRHEELIGIIANNRWLYTTDGRIVGKCGHRFKI